jgi:hypothetical protein
MTVSALPDALFKSKVKKTPKQVDIEWINF